MLLLILAIIKFTSAHLFSTSSSTTCQVSKTRVEWRELSPSKQNEFLNAVALLKKAPSQFPGNSSNRYDDYSFLSAQFAAQNSVSFYLPFHRMILKSFEDDLSLVSNQKIVLPYFQWSIDSQAPEDSEIFKSFGSNGSNTTGCVTDGAFANWVDSSSKTCLKRKYWDKTNNTIGAFYTPEAMRTVVSSTADFATLSTLLQAMSLPFLDGIGGSLASVNGPADPLYFLHYAFIDKLWFDWETLQYKRFTEYAVPFNSSLFVPGFNVTIPQTLDMRTCTIYSFGLDISVPNPKRDEIVINRDSDTTTIQIATVYIDIVINAHDRKEIHLLRTPNPASNDIISLMHAKADAIRKLEDDLIQFYKVVNTLVKRNKYKPKVSLDSVKSGSCQSAITQDAIVPMKFDQVVDLMKILKPSNNVVSSESIKPDSNYGIIKRKCSSTPRSSRRPVCDNSHHVAADSDAKSNEISKSGAVTSKPAEVTNVAKTISAPQEQSSNLPYMPLTTSGSLTSRSISDELAGYSSDAKMLCASTFIIIIIMSCLF